MAPTEGIGLHLSNSRRTAWIAVLLAAGIGVAAAYSLVAAAGFVAALILLGFSLFDVSAPILALMLLHMLGQPWQLSWASIDIAGANIYPNDILVLILLGAILHRQMRTGAVPVLPRDAIGRSVMLFLAYGLFALARSIPLHGWPAVLGFRQQIAYAILFFLVLGVMDARSTRVRLFTAILIAAVGVGINGVLNLSTGTPYGYQTSSHTLRYLSSFQAMTLFFGLSLLLGGIWVKRRPPWTYPIAGLCVFGILISQARSVWVAGVAGLLAGCLGSSWWRKVVLRLAIPGMIGVAILIALGGVDVGADITKRAASLSNVQGDVTWIWRLVVWGEALHKLAASPLLGLGLGKEFSYFDMSRNAWDDTRQIHNTYIELAYYIGAIGALIYVTFQVLVLYRLLRAARRLGANPRAAILSALASCHVCLMGVAFANVVGASMTATIYTWILGAIAVLEIRDAEREIAGGNGPGKAAGT
jgi:hypothetical protein